MLVNFPLRLITVGLVASQLMLKQDGNLSSDVYVDVPRNPLEDSHAVPKAYVDKEVAELRAELNRTRNLLLALLHEGRAPVFDWLHYASINPDSSGPQVTPAMYSSGYYPGTRGQFIHPCSWLQNGTKNFTTMALVMGNVVDYFRPNPSSQPCDMLQANNRHEWSSDPNTGFVTPVYKGSDLGGSNDYWPINNGHDLRQSLSFWGGSSLGGGCCSYNKWTARDLNLGGVHTAWFKALDLYWQ